MPELNEIIILFVTNCPNTIQQYACLPECGLSSRSNIYYLKQELSTATSLAYSFLIVGLVIAACRWCCCCCCWNSDYLHTFFNVCMCAPSSICVLDRFTLYDLNGDCVPAKRSPVARRTIATGTIGITIDSEKER